MREPFAFKAYTGATLLLSAALVAVALGPAVDLSPAFFGLMGTAAVVAALPLSLPGKQRSAPAFLWLVPALVAIGPAASVLVSATGGLVAAVTAGDRQAGRALTRSRRFAREVVPAGAAAAVYIAFGRGGIPGHDGARLALAAVAFYLVQSLLRALSLSLAESRPFWPAWREEGALLLLPHTLGFTLGLIVALALPAAGPWTLLPALVPYLFLVGRSAALARVERAHRKTVDALSSVFSLDDPFSAGHAHRVARYATALGRQMRLPGEELDSLEYAALLHEVGMLTLQRELAARPGTLQASELSEIRRGAATGADMITRLGYLPRAADFVRYHLHRYDGEAGSGPRGPEIPLGARILGVANALDAMLVRNRARRSLSLPEALAELRQGSGSQFDPQVVESVPQVIASNPETRNLVENPYAFLRDTRGPLGHELPRPANPAAQAAMAVQNAQLQLQVEEALKLLAATKSHTELVLDSLPDAVITTDLNQRVTFVNTAAAQLAGTSARTAVGLPLERALGEVDGPEPERRKLEEFLRHPVTAGGSYSGEIVVKAPDTRVYPARVRLGVLSDRERMVGLVGVVQDISRLKALEEQVKKAEKLAMLGELAASVAHEVRNPLAIVRGFAECLPQDIGSPEVLRESVSTILREVDRLDRVIEAVLSFARPARLEARFADLNAELGRVLDGLDPQATGQRVRLERTLGDLPEVYVDCEKMEQVFLNLALNALQAMPEGGTLRVSTSFLPGDRQVQVDFADTGAGIPSELRERIFQPFFTTKRKGTGLGLAVSSRIVEEHGGRIEVRSTEERGTTFSVLLPA